MINEWIYIYIYLIGNSSISWMFQLQKKKNITFYLLAEAEFIRSFLFKNE